MKASAALRWVRAVFMALFAWLAMRTAWLDLTLSPRADGTPMQSFVFFVLLPLALVILVSAIRDVRRWRRGESPDILARFTLCAELIGLVAVSVLLVHG